MGTAGPQPPEKVSEQYARQNVRIYAMQKKISKHTSRRMLEYAEDMSDRMPEYMSDNKPNN